MKLQAFCFKFLILLFIIFNITPIDLLANNSINEFKNIYLESDNIYLNNFINKRPNPLLQLFKKNKNKNKKITAAIFAFPLPFGIVGLHRIYLGCAPHIPVVYIASLGGAFGILPLIDFIVLLKEEDISKFNNSDKVFMWVE